jgi:Recombination endonuclease VII
MPYKDKHKQKVRDKERYKQNRTVVLEQHRKYRISNLDHIHAQQYSRYHGEPLERKVERIQAQHGLCANLACGALLNIHGKSGSHQDHNHQTGERRGVLCKNCNPALGHLKESREIILGLADYLEKWEGKL